MLYTAKELEKILGIKSDTISYYKRLGVITPVKKLKSGAWIYDESCIEKIKRYRSMMLKTKPSLNQTHTLCWTCIHTYGKKCPWMTLGKPVNGWQAKEIHLKAYTKPSYHVLKCPLYEKERFYTDKQGIKRRINTVPEMHRHEDVNALELCKHSEKFL